MMNGALSVMIFLILMMPMSSVNSWVTLVLLHTAVHSKASYIVVHTVL